MAGTEHDPAERFERPMTADEWRGVARGLHSHLIRTGRRQKDLAQAAGMAVSNLSAYLNLHRIPNPKTIRRILSAAMESQAVTEAMIDHWTRELDTRELKLQGRITELSESGLEVTDAQRDRLFSAISGDPLLASTFLTMADEIGALRTRCAQLAMAHTDAARESLVQSAVEAFQVDPKMRPFTREVEKDIRTVHAEERRQHSTSMQMLESILSEEGVRVERAEPSSPRSGRGRWEGLRWLLSLKDTKRAKITT
ncbi:helix-turn-helix domain-containing protein, partial [Candidatus Eisenbacteria bacterium]